VALYDYADCSERHLGHEAIIITKGNHPSHDELAVKRFSERFPVYSYSDLQEMNDILRRERVDFFYAIKAGHNDGVIASACPSGIHCAFAYHDPHGDVYAYISHWLSEEMSKGELPVVPQMVRLPEVGDDLRDSLAIPLDAIVFGRHGAYDTFDIPFVQKVIDSFATARPDVYFLFMNTATFTAPRRNVIFLPSTGDEVLKLRFINSCDAMLHARQAGETFGMSIAEFSHQNKPIITWSGSKDKAHYNILGEYALYYKDERELIDILSHFDPQKAPICKTYREAYSPAVVMQKFSEVFLR
jgi:hypothetical protein